MKSLFNKDQGQSSQLELSLKRSQEKDRNHHLGGRSFYFFDFDDNLVFLNTPLILFHKETQKELPVTSEQWVIHYPDVGKRGPYKNYEMIDDNAVGTFRYFRDHNMSWIKKILGGQQAFVRDIMAALGRPDFHWKGPSWNCFYHATFNKRPTSIITARGHKPDTVKAGISRFVKSRHLPHQPNILSIYPVSYDKTRRELGDVNLSASIPELKKRAIRASVEEAKRVYGDSPHHRFGMSDDDPKNIELIINSMKELKVENPQMSFFVVDTHKSQFVKWEIFENKNNVEYFDRQEQLVLS